MSTTLSTQKFWKVWGWFSNSCNSHWKSSRGEYVGEDGASNSTGDFDRIPDEILALIMKKLGPKETAKFCLVCKSWRNFVSSENRLWIHFFQSDPKELNWESVFFAEIHLRSGYPLQHVYDHMPPLSLMNIYALRAKVPGAVVVDGGSGYCKLGWSKYQDPSGRFATFLEFGNVEAPMYSRLRHFYGTIYNRADENGIPVQQYLFDLDALMIFCKGHMPIVELIMQAFNHFSNSTGLRANSQKSRALIAVFCTFQRTDCTQHPPGFSLGEFPVKYPGVPLAPKRWTKAECHNVVEKIIKRVK